MKKFIWPLVTKRELFLVLALAVLASFLSLLPTIWAYLKTPPGFWFVGFYFFYDPWDVNLYLDAIRQGFNGHWLYQNPYDPGATSLPVHFLYLFLGHLSRLFSLSIPWVYHLANLFLTITFSYTLYLFLAFVFQEKNWRLGALFLITFGGGIGWLFLQKVLLADLALPVTTVFQTLHLPHFLLNQTLFLTTLLLSFWAVSVKKKAFSLLSVLSGGALAFVHPYSLLLVMSIFGGYFLLSILTKKNLTKFFYLIPQFTLWTVFLLIFYLLLRQTPYLTSSYPPSPSPFYFLVSYGLLTPLVILGAIGFWQKKEEKTLFLLSWLLIHFLFPYLIPPKILAFKGFFIILGITAILGLRWLGRLLRHSWAIYFWVLFFSTFSTIFLTLIYLLPIYGSQVNPWTYLTCEEKRAFDFLSRNSKEGEIVLASPLIGNFIPANTNNRVYFGHDVSILNFQERRKNISGFYEGKFSAPPLNFLKKEKIDYVFWGPKEKELGELDLTKEPYLESIYQNEKVTLFKVR